MTMTLGRDAGPLAFLAAVVVIGKIPTLDTPYYWDEMAWATAAHWLWNGSLWQALPGGSPPAMFFGHPTALHATLATLWRLSGHSIAVAHGLALVFAVAGVCFTYLLGRTLYDRATGVLAALSLFLSPLYFAQAGMFLGDLPVTALGVMSAYFAWHGRYGAYLACAIPMVLIKETGMAIVVAAAVFVFVTGRADRVPAARRALAYAIPLIPIGVFLGWQKLVTGDLFFIMESPIPLIELSPDLTARKAQFLTSWLFSRQFRWVFTALVVLNVLIGPRARARKEWTLFALIVGIFWCAFYTLYFLPRYLLPAMPYLYIAGAGALMTLVPTRVGRVAAALALLTLTGWSLPRQRLEGNGEFNLRYRDVVALHVSVCDFLTSQMAHERIVTLWPHTAQLTRPFLGYAKRAVPAASLAKDAPTANDVIVVSTPGTHADRASLRAEARLNQWRLIRAFERGDALVDVYRR